MSDVEVYTPPPPPAQTFGELLVQMLRDPNIPADKMEVVLRANKENIEMQAREQFNEAFARMQASIPQVTKHGLVELIKHGQSTGSYKFAKWEDMDEVLRPILAEHGFSLQFSSEPVENGVLVQGELAYRGHSKYSRIKLPPDAGPGRNSLQAHGGALSYGKRYTAELLLNIVRRGEDDDAANVSLKKIDANQIAELVALLKETQTEEARFLERMVSGVTVLRDVLERDFARLVNALMEKKRARTR